ncbi:MAG: EVE domain-containing protein [Limnohabitans sp.]
MNYWIGVVSRSHVLRGVAGGFAQMNHGKQAPLQRMKAGDGLIYYSPREAYPDGAPLQAFTALGFIRTGEVYPHDMTPDGVPGFVPWRMDVDYQVVQSAPIKPLMAQLDFITDKTHWGAAFRFGQVKISEADFWRVAVAMRFEQTHERTWPEQSSLF